MSSTPLHQPPEGNESRSSMSRIIFREKERIKKMLVKVFFWVGTNQEETNQEPPTIDCPNRCQAKILVNNKILRMWATLYYRDFIVSLKKEFAMFARFDRKRIEIRKVIRVSWFAGILSGCIAIAKRPKRKRKR